MYWEFPAIQLYWKGYSPLYPYTLLLGLVDSLAPTNSIHTLLTLLLFSARKLIILSCKRTTMPTQTASKLLVNKAPPLYKATYSNRNAPLKFEKVLGWMDLLHINLL